MHTPHLERLFNSTHLLESESKGSDGEQLFSSALAPDLGLYLLWVKSQKAPSSATLRKMWEDKRSPRYKVFLMLATLDAGDQGWLCGWEKDGLRVVKDSLERLTAVCELAFSEKKEWDIENRIDDAFATLGEQPQHKEVLGLQREGLFSRHYITNRAWKDAENKDRSLQQRLENLKQRLGCRPDKDSSHHSSQNFSQGKTLQGKTLQGKALQGKTLQGKTLQGKTLQGKTLQGKALLELLGFETKEVTNDKRELVLSVEGTDRAFALLLHKEKNENFAYSVPEWSHKERPTAQRYAILEAEKKGLPFAIVLLDGVLRLYVRSGFSQEGEGGGSFSDQRFLQIDTHLVALVYQYGELTRKQAKKECELGLRCLAMLFSPAALGAKPCLLQHLAKQSRSYVDGVAERLRTRIYNEAMPKLAEALAEARGIKKPRREELDQTYEMAMTVLFRLLFVAYAEDKGLIPSAEESEEDRPEQEQSELSLAKEEYNKRSLKAKALELSRVPPQNIAKAFRKNQHRHWKEVDILFDTIDDGDPQMGLPAYNGGLFKKEPWEKKIVLNDAAFAPILQELLLESSNTNTLTRGPIDFADLQVRELGTIYEGLLESELSIANEDLTLVQDKKNFLYRPMRGANKGSKVEVKAKQIYVHNTSGQRKATGSYYTPDFCVNRLLDEALEPALKAHFAKLDAIAKVADINETDFFDFRVADIAMGSGHFLVAAAEQMAVSFGDYYEENKKKLRSVSEQLEKLRKSASERLTKANARVPQYLRTREEDGSQEKNDSQARDDSQEKKANHELLKRLLVRRCLYGVDMNGLAVQLARISLWIHSFVPGLPLSFLDRNLRLGNSLVGVGTMEEVADWVKREGEMSEQTVAEFLSGIDDDLRDLQGNIEASVTEVKEAEKAAKEIETKLQAATAVCDVITAHRIDEKIKTFHSSNWQREKNSMHDSDTHKRAKRLIEGLQPLHFPIAFPEVFLGERKGFDVILGNPPWEVLVFKEDQFWTRYNPKMNGRKQIEIEKIKARAREERADLVALMEEQKESSDRMRSTLLKSSYGEKGKGKGKGFGSGDLDLYKVFAWRYWQLLVAAQDERKAGGYPGGYLGVVLPRSLLKSKGSQGFRKTVLQSAQDISITSLINKNGWCFDDLHGQYAVALLGLGKDLHASDASIKMHPVCDNRQDFDARPSEKAIELKVSEVMEGSITATLPSFTSAKSLDVYRQLRSAQHLDHDQAPEWRARPYSELHPTHHRKLMDLEGKEDYADTWPIYKGESFNLWQADTGKYYFRAKPQPIIDVLQGKRLRGARNKNSPFSEFSQEHIAKPETLPCWSPRIVLRDITNATNTRTVICCLIPPKVFCQSTAPSFLFPRGDEFDQTYLLGILCSRPLDWFARRVVELHMTLNIINSLPIPRPQADHPLRLRLIELAGTLACRDARLKAWAKTIGVKYAKEISSIEEQDLIAEIDAVAAHLYDLSREQLTHIFETFQESWKYKDSLAKTLAHYERWKQKKGGSRV